MKNIFGFCYQLLKKKKKKIITQGNTSFYVGPKHQRAALVFQAGTAENESLS